MRVIQLVFLSLSSFGFIVSTLAQHFFSYFPCLCLSLYCYLSPSRFSSHLRMPVCVKDGKLKLFWVILLFFPHSFLNFWSDETCQVLACTIFISFSFSSAVSKKQEFLFVRITATSLFQLVTPHIIWCLYKVE